MRIRGLLAAILVVLSFSCVTEATPRVRLLGSTDGAPPREGPIHARQGQRIVLHAQLSPNQGATFRWFRLEPTSRALDNTQPRFHYADVSYARSELTQCRGRAWCEVDPRPTHLPEVPGLEGLGTMAFQVHATLPDGTTAESPGLVSRERGGLSRHVFRIAVRRDDTYLGYLTELLNTPYIFGSDGPPGSHQADLLIGSDCADLVVYGARRLGRELPYVSTWTLADHIPEHRRATGQRPDGVFLEATDTAAQPLRIGDGRSDLRPGDVLLFPNSRHTGVLWEDRPPLGVLDGEDLMFHTCWAPPTVEPLGASRCASLPIRILRMR